MSTFASLPPNLQKLTKFQKISLYALAIGAIAFFTMPLTGNITIFIVVAPVISTIQLIALYQMAKGLQAMWLYALFVLGFLIPPIALLFFAFLHYKTNKTLKATGVTVGLFGAKF